MKMRAKYLFIVCLILSVMTVVSCGKRSNPPPEGSARRTEKSEIQANVDKKPVAAEAETEDAESTEVEYFAVFMEGKKVGYAVQSRIESNGQVTNSEKARLTISRTGIPITVETTETTIETPDGKPLGFEIEQVLGAMTMMKTVGRVDEEGKMHVTRTSMGTEQTEIQQWPGGALMTEGLHLLTMRKGLKEGLEYTVKAFSPEAMQALDADIRIGARKNIDLLGRVVPLTEVKTALNIPMAGQIIMTEYIDDELNMQKSITTAMGMKIEIVACAKEFALGDNDVLDVVDKMFLASPVSLDNVGSAASITYHISATGDTELAIPSNDNQQVQQLGDGKAIITVKPVAVPAGAAFPYKGNDEEALKALKPSQFVQSDDEKIIALARRAVGDTKDAAEAAGRIEAFVADYVEDRSLSVGYASAAEVAESKQGDCSEFSVLTAAMCRAVGIPAQVVVGIAYVKEYAGLQDRFGGHAWVQAYIGGKWVGLDASFRGAGRGGYDAGHIALASGNGNPEDFFSMATTMGQFNIDKVTVSRR